MKYTVIMAAILLSLTRLVSAREVNLLKLACDVRIDEVPLSADLIPAVATSENIAQLVIALKCCRAKCAQIAGWQQYRGLFVLYDNGCVVPAEGLGLPNVALCFRKCGCAPYKVVCVVNPDNPDKARCYEPCATITRRSTCVGEFPDEPCGSQGEASCQPPEPCGNNSPCYSGGPGPTCSPPVGPCTPCQYSPPVVCGGYVPCPAPPNPSLWCSAPLTVNGTPGPCFTCSPERVQRLCKRFVCVKKCCEDTCCGVAVTKSTRYTKAVYSKQCVDEGPEQPTVSITSEKTKCRTETISLEQSNIGFVPKILSKPDVLASILQNIRKVCGQEVGLFVSDTSCLYALIKRELFIVSFKKGQLLLRKIKSDLIPKITCKGLSKIEFKDSWFRC